MPAVPVLKKTESPASAGDAASEPVAQRFVGMEYQMLRSKIEMTDAEGEQPDGWKPIADGDNLEVMTTEFFTDRGRFEHVLTEMADLAGRVAGASPGETIEAGNKLIRINEKDDSGQPQVNFDSSLQAFGAQMQGILEAMKGTDYLGADNPGFGWEPGKTGEQVDHLVEFFRNAETHLPDDEITDAFKPIFKDEPISPPIISSVRSYVLLRYSQHYQDGKDRGLTKDVPFLVKTDSKSLRDYIVEQMSAHVFDDSTMIMMDDLVDRGMAELEAKFRDAERAYRDLYDMPVPSRQLPEKDDGSDSSDDDRSSDRESDSSGEGTGVTERKDDSSDDADEAPEEKLTGVLIELRRVSILPHTKWVEFGLDAYDRLNELFQPDMRPGADPAESAESDDDDFGF
jgi:hypothetical protein